MYDDCVLRSARMGKIFNGNKMFAMFGGVLQHLNTMLFHRGPKVFDSFDIPTPCEFRSLEELLAAGYSLKSKLKDPFNKDEYELTMAALQRFGDTLVGFASDGHSPKR
jgi:hypothetical protein